MRIGGRSELKRDMAAARGTAAGIRQRGAIAVEFALISLPLIGLCMGILDFGWIYGQRLALNQVTREASRLAAVNGGSGANQAMSILETACSRAGTVLNMRLALSRPDGNLVGNRIVVTGTAPMRSVSGMYSSMLHDRTMTVRVEARMEEIATWSAISNASCP